MISYKTARFSFLIFGLCGLAACSSTGHEVLTPMPGHFTEAADPGDGVLVGAIQTYLADSRGPLNSQYEYVRMDLNNDGLREGIVLFNLPHSYWCGWGGCTMAIFQAGDDSFALLSETKKIRGPLVLADSRTNGWEDIIVRLSGMDEADRNVVLKFDGYGYPDNPVIADEGPFDIAALDGTRLFP